jgi:ribosomal protein S10
MYNLRINFKSIKKPNNIKKNLIKIKNKKKFKYIKIKGIFKIKNKNKIFTLLKSPHVNKKSREQFLYKQYINKINLKFKNIFQLFNFLIIIKKMYSDAYNINFKIIKNKMLIA